MHQVKGFIQIYSRQARDRIVDVGKRFLAQEGLEEISSELFACVDELIKNAVKSNYKFILIRERIFEKYKETWPEKTPSDIDEDINDIVKVPESFNHLAEDILKTENISALVREILNEESKLLDIKNRAHLEKRKYTENETRIINTLSKINGIRKTLKEKDIRILLRVQSDDDYIYIEVTNTAPILRRDLYRIHKKRDEHRRYKEQGREHEFFVDNLDTSEAGFGLGYAKIDLILNHWGLSDEQAITIISAINTTVMITLPIKQLRKRFNVTEKAGANAI
ncbi:MAG: hypothetical protein A2W19_12360 [Spirochaetes bacterium RBG_16_49_21]|nr:MAG: hypothetical protein A2W19_12360 [Spirochaetes bacterium RBG_16_49_21]